ncbi:kelch domain-containing protein 1-like isoform X1 [Kryptolebias marmoratus]|uniref:kelch domain-containing protein 1-like isoform X1 n=1 Tax=Kryptolebias marmoratus TaxID=37003 RepID=UPI000D53004A|nr:kelch domain-containing protein 1-like isoform X1 [Kryptolebias marmoratus]
MDAGRADGAGSRLERSSHTAFIRNNTLFVWGGYQVSRLPEQVEAGQDVVLPRDEIWLCDLDSGMWQQKTISGDVPSDLSGFCGANVNDTLYVFGGCDSAGYSNQERRIISDLVSCLQTSCTNQDVCFPPFLKKMFSADVSQPCCSWTRLTDAKGTTPSPRNEHSCWVHRERLIYFGGYGCKTIGEVRNTLSSSFIVEEMSWATIGDTLFRCWGWNNEVHVFDTRSSTWSKPETQGPAPAPRGSHAGALLGNKGYLSGGAETAELDIFCLDLESWTWTQFDLLPSCAPLGRSMHTMTPTSDSNLFVYGGLGIDGNTLNDAWQFNTRRREWVKLTHPHKDKPRVCHTACLGKDDDVVVFGGSSNLCIHMDLVSVLRSPVQNHCRDVFIFQTRPYSLYRLCEDFIGGNSELFRLQLDWLPSKLCSKIRKRVEFFSAMKLVLTA